MTPTESRRIRHIRTRRPIIGLSLAFVLGLGRLVVGCGNSRPANLNEQTDGAPLSGAQCAHPYPGCACSEKGETSPCGTVRIQSENFIQCSMGTTTCDGTSWGACDGSITLSCEANDRRYDNGWARPAGYAFSSVLDYARFVQFLNAGQPSVLAMASSS